MGFYCTCSYCLLFSRSVVSNSLRPHELQHARLPCPSLSPRVCPGSCLLTQWWHPTVSSSVIPFSSCPQSFLASGSFPWWVTSSHQITKVLELQYQSFSEYSGLVSFRIDWFDILAVQGLSKSLLQHHSLKKIQFFCAQSSLWSNSLICTWWLEDNIALTVWTFLSKMLSLLFNMLSRFVIAFLPRNKHLLISQLQSCWSLRK